MIFGFVVGLLPVVIGILLLLTLLRSLDSISKDVRRIADRLDQRASDRSLL